MSIQVIPLSIISSNLKIGLLAGIIGISASTGAAATVINSKPLSSAFTTAITPVNTFLKNNISPHLSNVYSGAERIGGKLGTWATEAYGKKDNALQWVKNNLDSSTLKSGFSKIFNQTKNWSESSKNALLSTYNAGKTTVLPFLSKSDQVRELLYYGSEASNVLKALGALLTASALSAATGGSSDAKGSEDDDEDEEEGESVNTPHLSKIWNLISTGHLGSVVSAIQELVSSNLSIVKTLTQEDINKIINFVLDSPDKVQEAVNNMKNPKDKNQDENTGQWGNYKDRQALMDALLPPPDVLKATIEILQKLLSEGEQLQDYFNDTEKKFQKDVLENLFGCATEKETDNTKLSSDQCSTGLTMVQVLTKLLGGNINAVTEETKDT